MLHYRYLQRINFTHTHTPSHTPSHRDTQTNRQTDRQPRVLGLLTVEAVCWLSQPSYLATARLAVIEHVSVKTKDWLRASRRTVNTKSTVLIWKNFVAVEWRGSRPDKTAQTTDRLALNDVLYVRVRRTLKGTVIGDDCMDTTHTCQTDRHARTRLIVHGKT